MINVRTRVSRSLKSRQQRPPLLTPLVLRPTASQIGPTLVLIVPIKDVAEVRFSKSPGRPLSSRRRWPVCLLFSSEKNDGQQWRPLAQLALYLQAGRGQASAGQGERSPARRLEATPETDLRIHIPQPRDHDRTPGGQLPPGRIYRRQQYGQLASYSSSPAERGRTTRNTAPPSGRL